MDVNVFETNPLLVARMDQLSHNQELQAQLKVTEWDRIVVDEAHRMGGRSSKIRAWSGHTRGSVTVTRSSP